MTKPYSVFAFLFACAAPAVCGAGQTKSTDCVKVSVEPGAQETPTPVTRKQIVPEDPRPHLRVILTNLCGVDVTAFVLTAHIGPDPGKTVTAGDDFLPRLLPGHPKQLETPAAGTQFSWDLPLPDGLGPELQGTVDVDALIFSDRTAAGNADYISRLLNGRKTGYKDFGERLEFLRKISDYASAQALLSKPPDASLSPSLQQFWRENQYRLHWKGTTAQSWDAYIARRKFETQTFISIFGTHSELAPGSEK